MANCCMHARQHLLHVTCHVFAAVRLRSELCNPAKQPPPVWGYAMCTAITCCLCHMFCCWLCLRSELCNPAKQPPPFRGYAMCTAAQTAAVIERLKQEPDFQKLSNLTPCALYRYLKGRTLWVMG
jgi:hypothetical protein